MVSLRLLLFKFDLRTCNPILLIPLILPGKSRIRDGRYNSPPANIRAEPESSAKQIKTPVNDRGFTCGPDGVGRNELLKLF